MALASAGNIIVYMQRLDGEEKEKIQLRLKKTVTIGQIKERVETELGILPHEQILIFRGHRGLEAKDTFQPLNTPDLKDIIEEAGEKGLQMGVVQRVKELPDFLNKEGHEESNERRKSGATPLHRAVRKMATYVVKELLLDPNFENVDARDRAGQTAAHVACAARLREPLEMILGSPRFSAVGSKDVEGRTILHLAAMWGDAPSVKLILEHPLWQIADSGLRDGLTNRNALQMAEENGHKEVVEVIQEKCGGLVDLEPAPPEEPEHWRWVKDEENWSRQSKPWIYTTFEPAAETEDTEAEGAEGAFAAWGGFGAFKATTSTGVFMRLGAAGALQPGALQPGAEESSEPLAATLRLGADGATPDWPAVEGAGPAEGVRAFEEGIFEGLGAGAEGAAAEGAEPAAAEGVDAAEGAGATVATDAALAAEGAEPSASSKAAAAEATAEPPAAPQDSGATESAPAEAAVAPPPAAAAVEN